MLMGRTRNINVCDTHKIMLSDHFNQLPYWIKKFAVVKQANISMILRIIKEVVIIDAFLHKEFHQVKVRQK